MLKYLSKIAMDILPSIVATVLGAYIVNHYIANKPAADAPAAAVSTVDPNNTDSKAGGKPAVFAVSDNVTVVSNATVGGSLTVGGKESAGGQQEERVPFEVLAFEGCGPEFFLVFESTLEVANQKALAGRVSRRRVALTGLIGKVS